MLIILTENTLSRDNS